MDLEFTDEQDELRRSVRAFFDRECPPSVAAGRDRDRRAGHRPVAGHGQPGLAGAERPRGLRGHGPGLRRGGGGGSKSSGRPSPRAPTWPRPPSSPRRSAEAGDPEQRQRFLGPVAAGERTGALALADHPRRWRPGEVTATAEPADGGWALSRRKQAVLAAPGDLDDLVVAARTGAEGASGLFVVPGAQLGPSPAERGLDISRPLATVELDGVVVPADRALGRPGDPTPPGPWPGRRGGGGGPGARDGRDVPALFDLLLAYAKDRHQFGVPIGSFQAVKHKMADAFVALERARALAYYAVAALAEDDHRRAVAAADGQGGGRRLPAPGLPRRRSRPSAASASPGSPTCTST